MGLYRTEKRVATVALSEYVPKLVNVAKFLPYCETCGNHGKRWACPPFDFDPMDIWSAYSAITLHARVFYPGEEATYENLFPHIAEEKARLFEELLALEEATPGSLVLSAGTCDLCEDCTRPEGAPCRHPDKLRYSIEALGGDVAQTAELYLGIPLKWAKPGQLPEYICLVGGLLT